MTAHLIDGLALAKQTRADVAARAAALTAQGRQPGLAVVLVGDNPASQVYVRNKVKACEEAGIASFEHRLPATTSAAELLTLVERLNRDPEVDGILVQLPLPAGLDTDAVIRAIVRKGAGVHGHDFVQFRRLVEIRPRGWIDQHERRYTIIKRQSLEIRAR